MAQPTVSPSPPAERTFFGFTPNVFILGLVSLLTDVSSEMTITLLPFFLANALGVRTAVIGLIEGVAESTSSLLRLPSGWLSDRIRARKGLTALGYAISSFAKPLLYFASSWGLVLAVRFADRVGKGVRTSPRDALLAESAPFHQRGRSFGFHRAADTTGAVVGLALAAAIMYAVQSDRLDMAYGTYQTLVLVGVIPAFVAVGLTGLLREPRVERRPVARGAIDPSTEKPRLLSGPFVAFLVTITLFTLGNSSDAFLLLRTQSLGLPVYQVGIVLVAFNLLYATVALPAGILSDNFGRKRVIVVGWTVYALIYLGFALASSGGEAVALFVLYGFYYGAVEGVARAYVADLVPAEVRATAYGLYHGVVGLSALPASVIAGLLWDGFGPSAPFLFGAVLAAAAMLSLTLFVPERARAG